MKWLVTFSLILSATQLLAATRPRNATPERGDRPMTVGIKPDLGFGTPGGQLGYWGVGNGGDWLRIGFARARDYAAQIVLRIKPESLQNIRQPEIREWIVQNQKALAADILQSEHVWDLEARPTCAWTLRPGDGEKVPSVQPIQFSYPSCRQNADSFLKAAQILIHEAVHHFNGDETTADLIAIGILDAWQNGLMDALPLNEQDAPEGSQRHAAVWTGEQMVVCGGLQNETSTVLASCRAYNPRSQLWTDLQAPAALLARYDAQMIWTGQSLLVWGGYRGEGSQAQWLYDGALYDPASKTWTAVAAPAWWAPQPSTWEIDPRQTMIWTGDRALIFGGVDSKTFGALGALFDPLSRSWTRINTNQAPLLIAGHSAVWTGSQMLVWGGYAGTSDAQREITREGARYDLKSDRWLPMSSEGAPTARAGHQAVWTGHKMVVLSGGGVGSQGDLAGTGAQYDAQNDSWTRFQTELMIERTGHKAVWNGEEVLLLGGRSNRLKSYFGELYGFNPTTLRWRLIGGGQATPARYQPSVVWTGSSALVWGGMSADGKSQRSGRMYLP